MITTQNNLMSGIRLSGPLAAIVAATNAGAQTVYPRSTGFLGTRSQKIRKLMISNRAAGNTFVHIGTGIGGAFVDAMPPIQSLNNLDLELTEEELPGVEFFATITAFIETLVAAGVVNVTAECEEIG